MKRADRKTGSDDNAANNPISRKKEPIPDKDLQQILATVRSQRNEFQVERDDFKQKVEEKTRQVEVISLAYVEEKKNYQSTLTLYQTVKTQYISTHTLYVEEQRKRQVAIEELQKSNTQSQSNFRLYQDSETKAQSYLTMYDLEKVKCDALETQCKSTLTLYIEEQRKARKGKAAIDELEGAKTQAQSYFKLHQDSQTQAQSYLTMYDSEKVRGDELVIQLNEVQGHRDRYLTLYNETQSELKTERRSKAGVKGWETRRKKENEKLKQEISEMAMVLRDSMERKDEAINSLYSVAERMDRIQRMVDSVDDDTATNPIGLLQKMQRMWQAVKEILAE